MRFAAPASDAALVGHHLRLGRGARAVAAERLVLDVVGDHRRQGHGHAR